MWGILWWFSKPAERQEALRYVFLLGLVSLLQDVASEMIFPLLPFLLTAEMGAPGTVVGLVEGLARWLSSLSQVASGRLSDLWGRRLPIVRLGYTLSALGKAFLPFASVWPTVLFGRSLDRIGKGVRGAPRDALLAAVTEDRLRGRAYGLHRALDSLGAVLGVAFSFILLAHWGRREILLLALIPAVGAVLILFLLQEPPSRPSRQSVRLLPLPRVFFPFLLFLFLITLADLSEQFLLLRARSLGFGEREAVGLYFVFSLFYALVAYPAGFLSDRVGRAPVLIGGYAFSALVYLGFGLVPSPHLLWLFFAAQGAYLGLAATVERAVVAGSVPFESRGTALGLYHAATGTGLLLASVIAGLLWDRFGPRAPFLFAGGITLVLLLPTALSLRALRVQRS